MKELIRQILKEETEHLSKQYKIKKMVLKLGWKKVAEMLGGFDNLYKIGFNNDYNEFLNLFNNLEVVQSEENPDWTLYRFEKGNNMMIYEKENKNVYINYSVIWTFFSDGIGINYSEIQDVMKVWLDEVYNLRGVTPERTLLYHVFPVG